MHFKKYILLYTLVPLIILFIGTSYFRFMVEHDYLVEYEGECDPYTEICFVGCEDEECTAEYYYTKVQKYAPAVYAQCGKDITGCDAAHTCLPQDRDACMITHCDPATDGEACETIHDASGPPSAESGFQPVLDNTNL